MQECIDINYIWKSEIFMISHDTPGIRTISDKFHYFSWFWSLVDKIPDKIQMIFILESDLLTELNKLIITSMNITDEERTLHIGSDNGCILKSFVFFANRLYSFLSISSLFFMSENLEVKDAFGNILASGDTVQLTKELAVKWTKVTLKKGTKVKGIRLTDDPEEISANIPEVKWLVLRTEFVKKI